MKTVEASPRPFLHKFPGISTGNADELSVALSPFFGGAVVEPERGPTAFRMQLNMCRLDRMSLSFSASPTAFKIDTTENSYFLHGFPVRGSAEHRNNGVVVEDLPDRRAVGEPGSLNLSFGPNFALFAVFLNQTSVSDALSALIGAPASRNLKLNRNHDGSEAPMIRGLVRLLIAELDREDCDVSPALLGEIQPQEEIVKSRPDRAILSTLLFHALRREELVRAEGEGQDALSAAASGHPWTDQRLPRPATK
jgi:hypothetical protein